MRAVLLALALAASAAGAAALGATEEEPLTRGDYLTIKVAVIGPGDELYFWWGHLGLLIEDRFTGEARFYDYGVFTFNSENFVSNFAFGRLWYTTMVSDANRVIARYIADDRSITLYTLNLDAAQKLELFRLAESDARPENRDYLYNHFTDNCVTRILNNLDVVLSGAFYEAADATPSKWTLRGHVRRHTAGHPLWDWLLNFLMGQVIDRPATAREAMFLPSEAGRFMSAFSTAGADGVRRPLVSSVEEVYRSTRPLVLEAPWHNAGGVLAAGITLGALLAGAARLKKRRLSRALLGAANALLGLAGGALGSVLFFMTFFTDHDYTFENSNVLFVNPLLFAALPLGLLLAAAKTGKTAGRAAAALRALWAYVALAALSSALIKLSAGYYQDNGFVLAFFIPVSAALIFASSPRRLGDRGQ